MRPLRGLQETRVAPAACSFLGENARSGEALGEARPGQSSLSVLSRSGGEKGLRGSGAGTLGVPLAKALHLPW